MSSYEAFIAGEAAKRGLFGGTTGKVRPALLAVVLLISAFLLVSGAGLWGIVVALFGSVGALLVTQRTDRGSILERRTKAVRWKDRQRRGVVRFEPYDQAQWDQLRAELRDLAKAKGAEAQQRRGELQARLTAMRANPDGADGMGWLQSVDGEPGIAWHAPAGEEPYLSVVFEVTGQLAGVEGPASIARVAERFSRYMAGNAPARSLLRRVQPVTRVLPTDTDLQQEWAAERLDPNADERSVRSYADVLDGTAENSLGQTHYQVAAWPITQAFTDAAAKLGPKRDGWRRLMESEILAALRGLEAAGQGPVRVLTAREVGAVIRNMQNPDLPLPAVGGVEPSRIGLPSRDEWSAHVVEHFDFMTGVPVEWWHRTAAIHSVNLSLGGRTPLWAIELMRGTSTDSVRTLSFHINLVPARAALPRAKNDAVHSRANATAKARKGQAADEDNDTAIDAAQVRITDLRAGSGHHGVEWVGYVTVSARSRDELAIACRELAEVADGEAGIERLEWLDSYQAAASGTTWPIARGLAPQTVDLATRATGMLRGRTHKEELT